MNKYIYILTLFVLSCTSNEVDETMKNTNEELNVKSFVESEDEIVVYDTITIPEENLFNFVSQIEKDERFLNSNNLNDFYGLGDTNAIYMYTDTSIYAPIIKKEGGGTSCLLGVLNFHGTKSLVLHEIGESCGVYYGFSLMTIISNDSMNYVSIDGAIGDADVYSFNINTTHKDSIMYFESIESQLNEDKQNEDFIFPHYIYDEIKIKGQIRVKENKFIFDTIKINSYELMVDANDYEVLDTIK